MKEKNASLLISSCDTFSDCWDPYFHGLKKYWPDCPYEVFIITNYWDVKGDLVRSIKVGKDRGWSNNTLLALKHITTPYIIYTHEDFWIKSRVDTKVIEDYIRLMETDKVNYIGIYPGSGPLVPFPLDGRLGLISDCAPYRTSLQVAIWRKDVLEDLIVEGENPWQFEILGTERSKHYGNTFLSVIRFFDKKNEPYHYGINYVCTAINKGRWSKEAKQYAEFEGLAIDFTNRPHEKWWHRTIVYGRIEHAINRAQRILKRL
jgi:hypothetical protein